MNIFEIIAGAVMLIASLVIILLVVAQQPADQNGMSGAITGGETYYGQGRSRTANVMLGNFTRIAAFVLFGLTIATHLVKIFSK